MHKGTWMLVVGLVLALVGLIGVGVGTVAMVAAATRAATVASSASGGGTALVPASPQADTVGADIYLNGVGSMGPVPTTGGPLWFRRMGGGCVTCHGADGRGGTVSMMMGQTLVVPDIRYSTLTSPRPSDEGTGTTPGWTDSEIATAIGQGIEPGEKRLSTDMPHWYLRSGDMQSLLDYLKGLSTQ